MWQFYGCFLWLAKESKNVEHTSRVEEFLRRRCAFCQKNKRKSQSGRKRKKWLFCGGFLEQMPLCRGCRSAKKWKIRYKINIIGDYALIFTKDRHIMLYK